jgi:hypothetical protein
VFRLAVGAAVLRLAVGVGVVVLRLAVDLAFFVRVCEISFCFAFF